MAANPEIDRIQKVQRALNAVIGSRENEELTKGMSTREVLIASLLHHVDVVTFTLKTEVGGLENVTEEHVEQQVSLYRTTLTDAIKFRKPPLH
jgi:ABC-type uncharacterized transport system ATPase subunit